MSGLKAVKKSNPKGGISSEQKVLNLVAKMELLRRPKPILIIKTEILPVEVRLELMQSVVKQIGNEYHVFFSPDPDMKGVEIKIVRCDDAEQCDVEDLKLMVNAAFAEDAVKQAVEQKNAEQVANTDIITGIEEVN